MSKSIQLGPYFLHYEDDEAYKHCLTHGENYESHIVSEMRTQIAHSNGLMDIGANVGFYTLMAKWWRGPAFPTVSVEVNPGNCQLILETIERNGFWNSLVIPAAASDHVGSVFGNKSWNTGIAFKKLNEDWRWQYPCLPMDNVDFGRMDTIKVDVEGCELFALRGLILTIAKWKPTLFFEYNPVCMKVTGVDPDALLQFVVGIGYDLTVLDYRPGMRATFNDPAACRKHIESFGCDLCDIMARPRS